MYRTHTSQVTMRILFQWHSDSVPHPTISLWENFYDGTPLTVAGQFRILTGFPTCLSALQNLLYFFIFYHQILIKSIICLYNFFISQYGYWWIISCIIIIASWIFTVADCRVTLYVLLHNTISLKDGAENIPNSIFQFSLSRLFIKNLDSFCFFIPCFYI